MSRAREQARAEKERGLRATPSVETALQSWGVCDGQLDLLADTTATDDDAVPDQR